MMTSDLLHDPLLRTVPAHEGYKVLGSVALYQKLGLGGMGAVFLGRHLRLHIDFAVKVMAPPPAEPVQHGLRPPVEPGAPPDDCVKRFLREARVAARIRHPNLIRVHDVNVEYGVYYLTMDFIEGESASARLKRKGPLPEPEAVSIVLAAAAGLAEAHRKGFVHRDVKPDNILIDREGRVCLADLGLARAFDSETALGPSVTGEQMILGSPAYMPPEQFQDARKVGPPGDVWTLGITLYHLLSGRLPWRDPNVYALAKKVANDPWPDVRALQPDATPGVAAILERACRKDQTKRYGNAGEMAAALKKHRDALAAKGLKAVLADPRAGAPTELRAAPPSQEVLTRILDKTTAGGAPAEPTLVRERLGDAMAAGAAARFDEAKTIALPGREPPRAPAIPDRAGDAPSEADKCPEPPRGIANSIGMRLVLVPAGEFRMGSPETEDGRSIDETPHPVTISKPFYLGATQVTQGQWKAIMGNNPSHFQGEGLPVEQVSWDDCREFLKKLSAREGREYRLPTEAEWEYACRAGTTGPFSFGETIDTAQANYNGTYVYGNGKQGEYRKKTLPVGHFKPNAWGLSDMHGNLWEWCADWYGVDRSGKPAVDPTGPKTGEERVLRGGSWLDEPINCRSSYRARDLPNLRRHFLGFRVAMVAPAGTAP
jgi:eukaryotic-like serine/threonine-protein kinase